jgi:hypothetical protein
MNGDGTEHPRFLPQLDPAKAPPHPGSAGAGWTEHGNGVVTLAKYSAALVVAGRDTPPERLKSIPSPWSRLLLFEQALFQRSHPAHTQVLAEWRGLLGCLGLAEYLGLQITATPVDFDGASGPMQVLRSMAPVGDASDLWNHHVLINISGRLVGGTSPRTLVFTGIRSSTPPSVPFQRGSRLLDPTAHYKESEDQDSLVVLERWLARMGEWLREVEPSLLRYLGVQPAAPGSDPVSRAELVKKLLGEWHEDTLRALDGGGRVVAPETAFGKSRLIANGFPDRHPAAEVFGALRFIRVTQRGPRRSDLRLRDGEKVFNPGARGILLRDNNPYTGQVQLPAGQHGSVKRGRFELALSAEQLGDPGAPDLGAFFERTLIEVVGAAPAHVSVLRVGGKEYLYPFSAEIMAHLEPESLVSYARASGDAAAGIQVTLDLPLRNDLVLRYEQDYLARDIVHDAITPNLAVWPDFQSTGWSHHFYFVQALQRPSLAITPVGEAPEAPRPSPNGSLTWGRLLKPARCWKGAAGDAAGLLPVGAVPSIVPEGETWDVAVDFGSTHTRAFRSTQQVAGKAQADPVDLKPRATMLLGTSAQLADSFFPALPALPSLPEQVLGSTDEPRSLVRLPLGTARAGVDVAWTPSDGVIYWGSLMGDPPPGLRANLKWHRRDSEDLPPFHSYISQLYLSIAAEAAAAGATVRSLVTAYPSVFPEHLRHNHEQQWNTLHPQFGVAVMPPVSESAALASYLAEERGATVGTNLLAIDVGGSTSDLAVWTGAEEPGDSVRMAGDILSRLLAVDEPARDAIQKAAQAQPIAATDLHWRPQGDAVNGLIFNALLRQVSRKTGSTLMLAKNMYQGRGSPGERVIAHAGYLYATVSYLLGLMVRRGEARSDRYEIHFAGHGSEFLKWLDVLEDNASSELPGAFFRAALGADAVKVEVHLPGKDVKQEVGRGLLAPRVSNAQAPRDRITFLGEDGFTPEGGEGWKTKLGFDTLSALQAPGQSVPFERLTHISRFVEVFATDPVARNFARALGITRERLDGKLRDRINDRLFGPQSAWRAARVSGGEGDDSLLEPFFVVEAKALLEHATGNHGLFSV